MLGCCKGAPPTLPGSPRLLQQALRNPQGFSRLSSCPSPIKALGPSWREGGREGRSQRSHVSLGREGEERGGEGQTSPETDRQEDRGRKRRRKSARFGGHGGGAATQTHRDGEEGLPPPERAPCAARIPRSSLGAPRPDSLGAAWAAPLSFWSWLRTPGFTLTPLGSLRPSERSPTRPPAAIPR